MTSVETDTAEAWNNQELERAATLATQVRAQVGADAKIVAVRAPGRVNLIGEHTDYSGLPVLPVAIDRSTIVVAAASTTREIVIANADLRWPARRFALERQIPPYPPSDWANYVKAAIQGVLDHFAAQDISIDKFRGATLAVDGRVPPAAGLSSSAALTVAAATTFMAVNTLELEPLETAQMVARSEWYVGTRAGGMDQAASILGRRDHAMFIEFEPLRVRMVKMPAHAALVVADSCEVADKSGRVRVEYNRRVVECSLAARILGNILRLQEVRTLGQIVSSRDLRNSSELIEALAANAPASLNPDLKEAARILGVVRTTLADDLLGQGATRIELDPGCQLKILKRARHVLRETERVLSAVVALETGDLREMGELMNQSHRSLAEDFACSTARLDAMVECARRGGALGARLTGAGFGGSIVALCEAGAAHSVIDALDRDYYAKLALDQPLENCRAVLHAGDGAQMIELAAA